MWSSDRSKQCPYSWTSRAGTEDSARQLLLSLKRALELFNMLIDYQLLLLLLLLFWHFFGAQTNAAQKVTNKNHIAWGVANAVHFLFIKSHIKYDQTTCDYITWLPLLCYSRRRRKKWTDNFHIGPPTAIHPIRPNRTTGTWIWLRSQSWTGRRQIEIA